MPVAILSCFFSRLSFSASAVYRNTFYFKSKIFLGTQLTHDFIVEYFFFNVITQLFVWLKWPRLFYVVVLVFPHIKHSDRCCQNLIINEDFSHSGPLITMATPSAANGHIAKMLLKRTASHTAAVQMSFSYLFSIMMLGKQHIPGKHLLCCAHVGPLKKKKVEKLQIKEKAWHETAERCFWL